MSRALTSLVLAVVSVSFAPAQLQVHDFKIDTGQRSQQLASLMNDAAKTYPELAKLKLNTHSDESAALVLLGKELAKYAVQMKSSMSLLMEKTADLEDEADQLKRNAGVEDLKKLISELADKANESREIPGLAERAYKLARAYSPPYGRRSEWTDTWKSVQRLVPHHM